MLYIFAVFIIFLTFVFGLKSLSSARPENVRRIFKYTMIVIGIVAIIFLFRFGYPYVAALIGGIAATAPYFKRIIQFLLTLKLLRNVFGQKPIKNRTAKQPMTKEHAREVLGVPQNASNTEIKDAYQKLMKKNHPDAGGTKYIASELNRAKDVLLKSKK